MREPLRPAFRADSVIEAARAVPSGRSSRHRGGQRLLLGEAALRLVLDDLVRDGRVVADGRRVRLADTVPALSEEMRDRIDRLLTGLREAGVSPPRVDALAARLGIPPGLIDQLRASGELVSAAPGIDYPRDVWVELRGRLDRIAASGPLTVGRVKEMLRTSRRHAEALLALRRGERERPRSPGLRSPRRGGPGPHRRR